MRVLFDGFWWAKGPIANQTVMREITHGWIRAFPGDQILIAVRRAHRDQASVPQRAQVVHTRLAPQALTNAIELALLARSHQVDAVVAHNYSPLLGHSAVFIHDLLFEDHPEWFTRKELAYFSAMAPLARFADVVATSSVTEARRIERLRPSLAPVVHTGLGISPRLSSATPQRPMGLESIERFVLSVGRLNRRKNLRTALEGAMRAKTVSSERPLVVVGSGEYSGASADLPSTVRNYVADGRLVFLGRVSDNELRWMYERADGLIFLSRDEGFGLPPVEAQYFGAPIIVSDIEVMREVADASGAFFVNPNSPSEVALAIDALPARTDQKPRPSAEHAWEHAASLLRGALERSREA